MASAAIALKNHLFISKVHLDLASGSEHFMRENLLIKFIVTDCCGWNLPEVALLDL